MPSHLLDDYYDIIIWHILTNKNDDYYSIIIKQLQLSQQIVVMVWICLLSPLRPSLPRNIDNTLIVN
jgi:hypothetical protein